MHVELLSPLITQSLTRQLRSHFSEVHLNGCTSTLGLAFLLTQYTYSELRNLPHLVVVDSESEALRLKSQIEFFNPQTSISVLSGFDVSPYSRLQLSPRSLASRLRFLSRAQNAMSAEIFIAPIEYLLQKAPPESFFHQNTYSFSANMDLPDPIPDFLNTLGYQSVSVVEDPGQYSLRGGVLDIFSPAETDPVRLSLFGNNIESIRLLDTNSQRSQDSVENFILCQAREILIKKEIPDALLERINVVRTYYNPIELEDLIHSLHSQSYFQGIDFLLSDYYTKTSSVLDYFSGPIALWLLDSTTLLQKADQLLIDLKTNYEENRLKTISPPPDLIYDNYDSLQPPPNSLKLILNKLIYIEREEDSLQNKVVPFSCHGLEELAGALSEHIAGSAPWKSYLLEKIHQWKSAGQRIFICSKNQIQQERVGLFLEQLEIKSKIVRTEDLLWNTWLEEQDHHQYDVHLLKKPCFENLALVDEKLIFLKDDDLLGKKSKSKGETPAEFFEKQAKHLTFGDLKPNDYVVHIQHGVGQYLGLKVLDVGGAESEFIQLAYKGDDRLYLPVYRIGQLQKFASAVSQASLDKLGGNSWEKTKIKVKSHLKDVAAELLQLYAQRAQVQRPPYVLDPQQIESFSSQFPYDETQDQLNAIKDILKDFKNPNPMDRLICGDVGFGKTEIAMRAAFFAASSKKQVALLAPTTVLTFQHIETFRDRFKGWPFVIKVINRFVPTAETKQILSECKSGKVDILIGTHRLLSKDVQFHNLGLMIIDEEQRFGVTHKERIKKIKTAVDTLTLSATPIPRTLNMSLVGIRDLSLINTAPVDRLPTRTFICQFDGDLIRKAVDSELKRSGQVYFIHNRIQSIYGVADELRTLMPHLRLRIAHGQMPEHELEQNMLAFFHHEIDALVCTSIVESGMDVPRANTMFIDEAQMYGLSQLYQLRGRVGRSKERAYCYLILPRKTKLNEEQKERLKILQDNTALGSGIKIAHYDLELRGAGNILGEDQSGHVNAVGYELYMELLHEALAKAKGEPLQDLELDPEVNLRIPALIPSDYIADIRIRLSYYKALADIKDFNEADQIEAELQDQFGTLPEPLINLIGLMLIRKQCKDLGVRDVSAGIKTISLIFTEQTRLKPETIVQLATKENKKYSVTPDNRFNIRMNTITWKHVHQELVYLLTLR